MTDQIKPMAINPDPGMAHSGMAQFMAAVNVSAMSGDALKTLLEVYQQGEAIAARRSFNEAVSQFRPPAIVRDCVNLHQKSRYVALDTILRKVAPELRRLGLSVRWETSTEGQVVNVVCVLSHSAGHSERTQLSSAPDSGPGRNAVQALGSAVTYLKRYTLLSLLGLAPADDDDGVGAGAEELTYEEALALDAIASAPTRDKLQAAWHGPASKARASKRMAVAAALDAAKDLRKKELGV